jgi:hypothetical protein
MTTPKSKRPTPKDYARLGYLTGRKLTVKQQAERDALEARCLEWARFRGQAGLDCGERRGRRIVAIRNRQIGRLEPLAKKGRAQVAQCKTNAPKGGKATAHYTDLVFELAVSQYRQKHPEPKAWDACHNLTRQGQPLEKLKPGSAYKRLERNAKKRGLSVDDYFLNLDR